MALVRVAPLPGLSASPVLNAMVMGNLSLGPLPPDPVVKQALHERVLTALRNFHHRWGLKIVPKRAASDPDRVAFISFRVIL